jgi:Zn-dependent protease
VSRHFKVHHIEGDRFRLAFFARETASGAKVEDHAPEVDKAFDALRDDLKEKSYVATLQLAGDDGVITVSRVVDPEFRSTRVNWIFFVLTLLSVQTAGAIGWAAYISPVGPTGEAAGVDWLSAQAQVGGAIFFAAPLLAILGLHEMGHFFTARHYNVRASLPFFIPSLPPLGTFGAFISMRDPLPSRRVIFDIGLSGPLIGFLASIVVTALGTVFMAQTPSPTRPEIGGGVTLGTPIMFDLILRGLGSSENSYLHPTLFAGWAGFLVTAFNLIPAAQLDGGHVFFSLLGNGAKRESRAVAISVASVMGIAVLGSLLGYNGWLLLLVIVFLTIRHPPPLNQISSLDFKRLAAGVGALMIFVVSFSPAPIQIVPADYAFELQANEFSVLVPAGGYTNLSFNVSNLGNAYNPLVVEVRGDAGPFTAFFNESNTSTRVTLNKLEWVNRTVNVTIAALTLLDQQQGAVYLLVTPVGEPALQKAIVVYAITAPAHPALDLPSVANAVAASNSSAQVPIFLDNTGDVPLNLTFNVSSVNSSWAWGFGGAGNLTANVRLAPGTNATLMFEVAVPSVAQANETSTFLVHGQDANWTAVRGDVAVEVRCTG